MKTSTIILSSCLVSLLFGVLWLADVVERQEKENRAKWVEQVMFDKVVSERMVSWSKALDAHEEWRLYFEAENRRIVEVVAHQAESLLGLVESHVGSMKDVNMMAVELVRTRARVSLLENHAKRPWTTPPAGMGLMEVAAKNLETWDVKRGGMRMSKP
jgi:hypothetical protein